MLETIKNKHLNLPFKKLSVSKFLALLFLVFSFSFNAYSQDVDIAKGKSLFNANCAACHKLNKNLIGPALAGVSAKYEKEWLYSWIKNSSAMIKAGDERAVAIWEEYNKAAMNAFPQLSNMDIDNILAYTDYKPEPVVAVATTAAASQSSGGGYNLGDSISKYVNEKYLGDSIYFYFETPNYKVRIGKYKSKIEAEKKLKEIKKEFKSAFVFKPSK